MQDDDDDAGLEGLEGRGDSDEGEQEEKEKLHLDVKVDSRGACQRHITVTIPREDIERYYDRAFSEMVETAAVPGFRPGRAPRKLVEARYRRDVAPQVKGSLLMDSLAQVTEEQHLAPISEPDFDPTAVELPDDGPLVFEFNLEVRPEFDLPDWKGLVVERPVREFTEQDVDRRLKSLLAEHGRLVPHDGPAEPGDYVTANLTFKHGDEVVSSSQEEVIRIRPVLSFRDGRIEGFDKLMAGVRAGETRVGKAKLSPDAPNAELRGQEIDAVFEVLEVKKLELPELTPQFLLELGDFESEEDLRRAVRAGLEMRLGYFQHQRTREQITSRLIASADWELPPEMLRRQAAREFERAVFELRRSGFNEQEIRARVNELRQNSAQTTARALKEHFILERIAEEEKIDASEDDFDAEIRAMANQRGESPRRLRAYIEKHDLWDVLRNQIVERKVIELIMRHATFHDVPFEMEAPEAEAIDQAAGGAEEEAAIPEAKYPDQPARSPVEQERR